MSFCKVTPLITLLAATSLFFVNLGFHAALGMDVHSSTIPNTRKIRSLRMNRSWTRSGYGVVFVYSSDFNSYDIQKIGNAVAEIRKYSCYPVTLFSQHQFFTTESRRYPNYVFIEKNAAVGCGQAFVGMRGGSQLLTLSPDPLCFTTATIIHEMLHTFGIEHEQSRPDRSQYIRINNPNVQAGLHNVFNIAYGSTPYGPYDFNSIMHYGRFAFSHSPYLPTLASKVAEHNVPVNGNNQLSFWDKRKINFITGCAVQS